MKTTTPALAANLDAYAPSAEQKLLMADLYTITLQAGSAAGIATGQGLAYTDLDVPVAWNSLTYLSNSVQVSGLKYKASIGVDADAQQITLAAYESQAIGGVPFLQALRQGLFDGAEIQRERAFFSSFSGLPPLVPIGTVLLFKGRVTRIDSIGRTQAKVTVESDPTLLKQQMPRNYYSTSCVWVLYGSGCQASRSAHTASATVGAGSTESTVLWSGATADYQQGSITFTSGPNTGLTANVKTAATGVLTLIYPLLYPPAAGDAFTATQGCDHTLATCTSRFSNQANFRGFPYIPPPQVVSGPMATTADASKG